MGGVALSISVSVNLDGLDTTATAGPTHEIVMLSMYFTLAVVTRPAKVLFNSITGPEPGSGTKALVLLAHVTNRGALVLTFMVPLS